MFRLVNTVQHYDWGSTGDLPALLGLVEDGRPFAELWVGAHPAAPSIASPGGRCLGDLISREPRAMLGERTVRLFGARLPFLAKVLAAGSPLSLQAHPSAERARQGHRREQEAGLEPGQRNYRDPWHKPELLVALGPMRALAGFRRPDTAADALQECGLGRELADVIDLLRAPGPEPERVQAAFGAILPLPAPRVASALGALVSAARSPRARSGDLAVLLDHFPDDPGVLAASLLEPVSLAPGQGLFVGAGIVHCYLEGFGVEVMAASDNVLRAGLTNKRVDVAELTRVVDFTPSTPRVVDPVAGALGRRGELSRYRSPAEEFEVSMCVVAGPGTPAVAEGGPRVALCLDGEVRIHAGATGVVLDRGESAFIPDRDGRLSLDGNGRLVLVTVPLHSLESVGGAS